MSGAKGAAEVRNASVNVRWCESVPAKSMIEEVPPLSPIAKNSGFQKYSPHKYQVRFKHQGDLRMLV